MACGVCKHREEMRRRNAARKWPKTTGGKKPQVKNTMRALTSGPSAAHSVAGPKILDGMRFTAVRPGVSLVSQLDICSCCSLAVP